MCQTRRNVRTRSYKERLEALPESVQRLAQAAFRLFQQNPAHPSLRHHELKESTAGRHRQGSRAVNVGYQYRAVYVPDGNDNVWYWIGTHQDYNTLIGSK
jgi:hypothetical protein